MKKRVAVGLVAAVAAALGTSGNAAAFTNVTDGGEVVFDLASSTVSLGSFDSCTSSTLSGVVPVGGGLGPGNGGSIEISSALFGGCQTFGSTHTQTAVGLPWSVTVHGTGHMELQGVGWTKQWGFLSCTYEGDLTASYNELTGRAVLAGTMAQTGGSGFCPDDPAVQGTYEVTNADGDFVLL